MDISINAQQKLFVLKTQDGFTCLGFNNARDHAALIAKTLTRLEQVLNTEIAAELRCQRQQSEPKPVRAVAT